MKNKKQEFLDDYAYNKGKLYNYKCELDELEKYNLDLNKVMKINFVDELNELKSNINKLKKEVKEAEQRILIKGIDDYYFICKCCGEYIERKCNDCYENCNDKCKDINDEMNSYE